jgi:hypothetical protein
MTSQESERPAMRHLLTHADEDRNARRESIRADITRRLRKACSHLGDEEFANLIEKMVNVQLRSERGARNLPA